MDRRRFLALAGTTAALAGLGAYYQDDLLTTDHLDITDLKIQIPSLPEELNDFSIAFISDIHYSPALPREWIRNIVQRINKQKVDLVLLGGDYLWIPYSAVAKFFMNNRNLSLANLQGNALAEKAYRELVEELTKLKSNYGTYAVLGNHDRWTDVSLCLEAFKSINLPILIETAVKIPTASGHLVEIYGADDYWTGTPKKASFASTADLKILLSHNPDHVIEVCKGSLPADTLALCGHTHGGQIRLPGIGPLLHNIRSTRYSYGFHQIGSSGIFTSRGIGVVELPYRILCPQELVFIKLYRGGTQLSRQLIDPSTITV